MPGWVSEVKAIDSAVYAAIAAGETPSLDVAMRACPAPPTEASSGSRSRWRWPFSAGPAGRRAARRA